MKKIAYFLSFVLLLNLTSCAPEEDDVPSTINADDLVGQWSCTETGQFGTSTYDVAITKSGPASDQFLIKNFYQLGDSYLTSVNISGTDLSIPQQTQNDVVFKGSGTIINLNRLNLSFTADDGGGTIDNASASLSR